MPSLMLRHLEAGLVVRLRAYARDHALALPEACALLLERALRQQETVTTASHARAASLSPERRSEIARIAVAARERKRAG